MFATSGGWFPRFEQHSSFHNASVYEEAANEDVETVKKFLEWLQRVMMNGGRRGKIRHTQKSTYA
jgi:hypothetical protein